MLKKRIVYYAALLMTITGVLGTPVICHGEENSETMTESSDLIAGEGERAAQQKWEGRTAVDIGSFCT